MNTSVPPPAPGETPHGSQTPPPAEDQLDRFFRSLRTIGLHRSTEERWVGGVCGGLAERLRVDPLIVRAAFILLGLVFGAGITLYLIAWVLLPDRTGVLLLQSALRGGDGAAITLVVMASIVAVSGFGLFWGWGGPAPIIPVLLLVGVVVYLFGKQTRSDGSPTTGPAPTAGPAPAGWHPMTEETPVPETGTTQTAPPTAEPGTDHPDTVSRAVVPYAASSVGTSTTDGTEPLTYTATSAGSPGYTGDDTAGGSIPPGSTPPPMGSPAWVPPPPAPRRRRLGSAGTLVVLGLAAIVGSATTLVANSTDLSDVSVRLGIAAAAATTGIGVIVAGIVGRKAGFASFAGLMLALATALGAAMPKDFSLNGPHGEFTWEPTSATASDYRVGAGEGRLDLRRIDPGDATAASDSPTMTARVSFGNLRIIVPDDLPVRIVGHVDGGNIRTTSLGAASDSGKSVSGLGRNHTVTLGDGRPVLTVDADVNFGEIIIERAP